MDTLTSSVSNLRVPTPLHTISHDFFHLKNSSQSQTFHNNNLPHLISSSIKSNNAISPKPSTSLNPLSFSSTRFHSSSPIIHRKPATGYAAALVEIAQCNGSLHSVESDVERFLKLLKMKEFEEEILKNLIMSEKEKGRVIREVVEKGRFHRYLVKLTKMLVEKGKVGILKEVLSEFEWIYDELCGTQVVFVSSNRKMEDDQLFGIAKKVQKLSGAARVKVRNFVHGGLV